MYSYIKIIAVSVVTCITLEGSSRRLEFSKCSQHPLAPVTQQELHSGVHKKIVAAATQQKIHAAVIEMRRERRVEAIARNVAKAKKSKEFAAAIKRGQLISMIMPDDYATLTTYITCIQETNHTALYTILGIPDWAVFKQFCNTAESVPGTMQLLAQEYPEIVKYKGIGFRSFKKH